MKITGKKSLSNAINNGLRILFIIGILVIVLLPIWLKYYCIYLNPSLNYNTALIILYLSGIPGLIIVWEFVKMFGTLKNNNPFVKENVKVLKVCSLCSFIILIEYLIGIFFIRAMFPIVAVVIFAVAWLGLYILSELLKQAIKYKEENDLTI